MLKIAKNAKVKIDYTLKSDAGDVIDSSQDKEPLAFLQGNGQIIPGLEQALEGREAGDNFSVTVNPDQGYGEYDKELVFDVPREQLQNLDSIEEGMQVQAQMQDGSTQILTIQNVGEEQVTLDANHPLAGETLHFDIEVADVSEATDDEIEHGHAH